MSVLEPETIDIISVDQHGRVVLTISDHLSWDDKTHLNTLQVKLNAYLAFVESGEIYLKYPYSRGRKFVFKVGCKFQPNEVAISFLARVKEIIENAGFEFQYSVFATSYDN